MNIESLTRVATWKELCPELSITEQQPLAQKVDCNQDGPIRPDAWNTCKELLNEDGYFAYDAWFNPEFIQQLSICFDRLQTASLHPIFAFAYDEFWELMLRLKPLFSDLLDEYWMLPAIWAWHVDPTNQTAFAPHRDQVRDVAVDDEDHLDYLTVWIPLTDLDHLSSCMCVLPASADPDYDAGTARVTVENLQDIRTLQGSKGSVFCWTTGLIHWGTRQSEFGEPRKSVGLYLQNPEAECFDPPPLDLAKPLSLPHRLRIIGQQIMDYARNASEEDLKLAHELMNLTDP